MQKIIDAIFSQTFFLKLKIAIFNFLIKNSFSYKKRMAFYDKVSRLTSDDVGIPFAHVITLLMNQQIKTNSIDISIPRKLSFLFKGKEQLSFRSTSKSLLYYVYEDILDKLKTGSSESESLKKFLPETDVMMVEAFVNDDISIGFKQLIEYNEKIHEMNSSLKKAVIKPAGYFIALYAIIGYFSLFLIPEILKTLPEGAELSWGSEVMVFLNDNYISMLVWTIIIVIAIIAILSWALPRYNGSLRLTLEAVPPFSIYKIVNGCGFLNALNSLTSSGFQEFEAIEKMRDLAVANKNIYMAYRLNIIVDKMKQSASVGAALVDMKLNFPDKEILKDLEIYSTYGILDESLSKMTEDITEKGLSLIKIQAKVIEVVMLFVVVLGLLTLFNGIFSMTTDLSNSVSKSSLNR